VLVTAQWLVLCWSQLKFVYCVGHIAEADTVLVIMLCWSLCCVGHSLEAYAVLVTAQRLMLCWS